MQRPQLEHLIRAAGEITNQYEFVVVGSRALVASKACATREKDAGFNRALLRHGIVRLDVALQRVRQLEDPAEAQRAEAWIRRLAAAA